MAMWTHTTATGTGSVANITWTTASGTASIWNMHSPPPPPAPPIVPPTIRAPFVKKGFWDGVEWKEYTSYIPRKSITGKWIIGPMYRRWRTPEPRMRGKGLGTFKEFAGKKELFEEKLRGNA